jgi:hypothetical protein
MQRYEGFWEYKVLGYVSLLDSYLNIQFKGAKRPAPVAPRRRLARLEQKLAEELPALTQAQRNEITNVVGRVFAIDDADFGDRYCLAIAATDRDIVKIIKLSEAEFELIKRVRNKIAHGKDHGLQEGEFTTVVQAEGKIALLLTYWAFLDIGLTKHDFIRCLNTTHSKLRFSARLDDVHLSRVSKSAEFFPVTMERLQFLRGIKGLIFDGCCIQEASGELNYSEGLAKVYKDWIDDRSKSSGVGTPENVFGIANDGARMVGQGYFECGDERLRVIHMWIIKRSALPA